LAKDLSLVVYQEATVRSQAFVCKLGFKLQNYSVEFTDWLLGLVDAGIMGASLFHQIE
jgi:hypothetical protein